MDKNPRGMLLLDKPIGITSFQALGAVKRHFNTKKVGHAGTLDKFASGLLLVFVGEATRLVPWFVGLDKTYVATIRFGQETDTLDPEGEVIREALVPDLTLVQAKLHEFIGAQIQIPPVYSAIHVDGKRAYERVLAGEKPEMKPRKVNFHELAILDWQVPDLTVRVSCSSGTYIRSLARDIGLACNSAAYLVGLRRSRVGCFDVDNASMAPLERSGEFTGFSSKSWLVERRLGESMPGCGLLGLAESRIADFRNGKLLRDEWFYDLRQALGQEKSVSCWAVVAPDEFFGIIEQNGEFKSYRLVFPGR